MLLPLQDIPFTRILDTRTRSILSIEPAGIYKPGPAGMMSKITPYPSIVWQTSARDLMVSGSTLLAALGGQPLPEKASRLWCLASATLAVNPDYLSGSVWTTYKPQRSGCSKRV